MKPSLRRDSLEKAAEKFVELVELKAGLTVFDDERIEFEKQVEGLLQRRETKVRRETLKEAASGLYCLNDHPSFSCVKHNRQTILSLTPRGPEKGRRAK